MVKAERETGGAGRILGMITWLADQPRGSALVDWLPAAAAACVLLAAIITAVVARRNVLKPWFENLETLINVYNAWPDGLEGKATLEHAIADLLAQIRFAADEAGNEEATMEEKAAEQRVSRRSRRAARWIWVCIALVFGGVALFLEGFREQQLWILWIATGMMALGVLIGRLFKYEW
ncbi:hypothetical protein ACQP2U_42585 (plasmid) [Nocardia sp. CA-084685]|uniref:hypothetical protein n=1 Tax=Nocardia sp. CA-084685 TaxID=3239970 RepID=UPI003D98E083